MVANCIGITYWLRLFSILPKMAVAWIRLNGKFIHGLVMVFRHPANSMVRIAGYVSRSVFFNPQRT